MCDNFRCNRFFYFVYTLINFINRYNKWTPFIFALYYSFDFVIPIERTFMNSIFQREGNSRYLKLLVSSINFSYKESKLSFTSTCFCVLQLYKRLKSKAMYIIFYFVLLSCFRVVVTSLSRVSRKYLRL